jgi:hypothetical protein
MEDILIFGLKILVCSFAGIMPLCFAYFFFKFVNSKFSKNTTTHTNNVTLPNKEVPANNEVPIYQQPVEVDKKVVREFTESTDDIPSFGLNKPKIETSFGNKRLKDI